MENENALSETLSPELTNLDLESLAVAWETSGLTRQTFCERHQINYRQFVYQRSKLNEKRKHKSSKWLAVKQTLAKSPSISAATTATTPLPAFLLRSAQGHQLSIPLDADTPTLKILLAFMREN